MTDLCKEINEFGKGIGNKSRYRILEALLKGRKTVGELVGMVSFRNRQSHSIYGLFEGAAWLSTNGVVRRYCIPSTRNTCSVF